MNRTAPLLLATGLLALAPVLSSCGFDAATDRVNTISAGVNNRQGNIDVLGAVVVSSSPGAGIFAATLSNNTAVGPTAADDALVSLTSNDAAAQIQPTGSFTPIPADPGKPTSMFSEHNGIPVTGSFLPGDFVTVELGFRSGQSTTITVPVVKPCNAYADVSSTNGPTATPTPSATPGGATSGGGAKSGGANSGGGLPGGSLNGSGSGAAGGSAAAAPQDDSSTGADSSAGTDLSTVAGTYSCAPSSFSSDTSGNP